QVKGWDEYTSETFDYLWACVKCSFDDLEYRRESVMKHARRLFRDARRKLKRKYFNDIRLNTKDERLKISLEKSKRASESRAHQKMPHYNGTKSFSRLRQKILFASRTRKSKKAMNALTLEKNTLALDEIKKIKEQRDQGCAGKYTHGCLRAYGPGKSIAQHFKVKRSRLDLSQELIEVKKKVDQLIEEARKMLKMLEQKLKRPKRS
ncbi:Histidine--tRNA ligase, partial [Bienertia sinuspersici]